MPNEKVSVLDALGLAGDLTIYGKRENVLLVREVNGKKEFARLDLNSKQLFNSPYYYLKRDRYFKVSKQDLHIWCFKYNRGLLHNGLFGLESG